MPRADFHCPDCNVDKEFQWFSYPQGSDVPDIWPACDECGAPMKKRIARISNFHATGSGGGDFQPWHCESAGRMITTASDQKVMEKDHERRNAYIPTAAEASRILGTTSKPIPMIKEQRKNISRFGKKFLAAEREERRRKGKT